MTSPKKLRAAAWITHDGEDGPASSAPSPALERRPRLGIVGRMMCRQCGFRADEPQRHYAIMSIECVGGVADWSEAEGSR